MAEMLDCDVLVVGSGAGGLLAANRAHDLGLKVVVIEKSPYFGGTSSVSGGALWIPNNDFIRHRDSRAAALDYLKACTHGLVAEEKLLAYIDNAPETVRYMAKSVGLVYRSHPDYPDYYQDRPGATTGRTMMPDTQDAAALGPELENMRPAMGLFGRYSMPMLKGIDLVRRMPFWQLTLVKMVVGYWLDWPWRLKSVRDRRIDGGPGLAAGLRIGLLRRNVPVLLKTGLVRLTRSEGRVTGAVAVRDTREVTIRARKGVILAAGGFERNPELRARYLPQPDARLSNAPEGMNVGDALTAGLEVGAAAEFLDFAWWTPAMRIPRPDVGGDAHIGLFLDRGHPGSVCVNQQGRRYVNEAISYNDFGYAMLAEHERTGAAIPSWLVFDAVYRRNYNVASIMPASIMPDRRLPPDWIDNVFYRAGSLAELAVKIGVDGATLADTVDRMNRFAASGVDEEFGRGGNLYDRFFADRRKKPNPCLGRIAKPPFYAVRVVLGDIGTKGGLKTNADANVLDEAGRPIPGLYATGNTAGAVTAESYPGAGGTLGPAVTFGFIAANHLARQATGTVSTESASLEGETA